MNGAKMWSQQSTSGLRDENQKRSLLLYSLITAICTHKQLPDIDSYCSVAFVFCDAGRRENRSDVIVAPISTIHGMCLRSRALGTRNFSWALCVLGTLLSIGVNPLILKSF